MATLATYLNQVDPIVNEILSIASSNAISEQWIKNQEHISMESPGPITITHDDNNNFFIQLNWDLLSDTDTAIVIDFFESSTKGNGIANTFKWMHPVDENFYTVRFESKKMIKEYGFEKDAIQTVTLKILGFAELANDYIYDSSIKITSDEVTVTLAVDGTINNSVIVITSDEVTVTQSGFLDSFVDRTSNTFVDRLNNSFVNR